MAIKHEPYIEIDDEKITKTEIQSMDPEQFKMLGSFLEEKELTRVVLWWDKSNDNDSYFSAIDYVQEIQRNSRS